MTETMQKMFWARHVFVGIYVDLCEAYGLPQRTQILTDGQAAWALEVDSTSWSIPILEAEHDEPPGIGSHWRLLDPPAARRESLACMQQGMILHFRVNPIRGYVVTDGEQSFYCRSSDVVRMLTHALVDTKCTAESYVFGDANGGWL